MDSRETQIIAWDGICFSVPGCWEPSRIGRRYLMLSKGEEPVMEVKWGPGGKSFSHEKYLSRLISSQKGKLKNSIRHEAVSEIFTEALRGYEVSGFSWQNMKYRGTGLIISCPRCTTTTLVQFFRGNSTCPSVLSSILSSFTDHRDDKQVLWSLFGIRALIPNDLNLKKHLFNAGAFELVFASRKREFSLYRWAPAGMLLSGIDLGDFAERTFPSFPYEGVSFTMSRGFNGIKWDPPFTPWWKRLPVGLFRLRQARVWHDGAENLLFGVTGRIMSRKDMNIIDRISCNYGSV